MNDDVCVCIYIYMGDGEREIFLSLNKTVGDLNLAGSGLSKGQA